ncbi:inositol-3-phosphate synthase [Saccharothrix sp. ST-888]|uniref:inositol-3-phosphate synthase n=1 Tax=Saccharothrix sp. ST-888 TaxID=1427391 RepID=UPI0005EC4B4D|nr:inositol-3-phosphate synthase [Saccharothrix sp. ST-888]KJK56544.1 myo-inositol-1-phosphate synthase [Saccharothrix sp. ST-888]
MAGRTGLWLIGARGSVATTAVCGLSAFRAGLVPATGCVSERLDLDPALFPGWSDLVTGGHDIVATPLAKRAEDLADAGVLPGWLPAAVAEDLRAADREIRPGFDPGRPGPQAEAAGQLASDIAEFRRSRNLDRVVVVNVSSTEPPITPLPEHAGLAGLERALAEPGRPVLPPSALAAYAAFSADCPYVDFTPSPGLRIPAVTELADRRGLPYAGCDGKTGETLLRSALAPMFLARGLRVRSWSGTNLLGGGDGANLGREGRAEGKLAAKTRGLAALLGTEATAPLHIDHVPDLGERKVAWDYVSFEGFLGASMSLQLTWDGYDSALAAPLVLDLARLVAGAHAAGESGPLGALAFFFKDPLGSGEHRLAQQEQELAAWADRIAEVR